MSTAPPSPPTALAPPTKHGVTAAALGHVTAAAAAVPAAAACWDPLSAAAERAAKSAAKRSRRGGRPSTTACTAALLSVSPSPASGGVESNVSTLARASGCRRTQRRTRWRMGTEEAAESSGGSPCKTWRAVNGVWQAGAHNGAGRGVEEGELRGRRGTRQQQQQTEAGGTENGGQEGKCHRHAWGCTHLKHDLERRQPCVR